MELIGQDRILNIIKNKINEGVLSKSILLVGEVGCGKHTLSKIIAELLNKECIDITNNISYDFITSLYLEVFSRLYVINLDELSLIKQNELLKLLEEPPTNAYFCILTSQLNNVLDTIKNRCVIYEFDKYTQSQLTTFLNNQNIDILEYCNTPGDVIRFQECDVGSIAGFVMKIFTKVGSANHSNILTISEKLAWKNEKELFNTDLFFRVLLLTAFNNFLQTRSSTDSYVFDLTNQFANDLHIPKINKKQLFEKYLFDLKDLYDGTRN